MSPATILTLVLQYRYPILVPAAFLAGFPVGMVAGVAMRLGYLDFATAYLCLMLGELIGDALWYGIGYQWGENFVKRFGKYVGITHDNVEMAKKFFRVYDQRILFSSKLTTGFGFAIPILFTAGLSRVSFRRYMMANISGQFIWTGGLIAIGYFFGNLYVSVNNVFEKVSTISLFVIVIACLFGFARYLWSRVQVQIDES
jgi:membrane-associated protein